MTKVGVVSSTDFHESESSHGKLVRADGLSPNSNQVAVKIKCTFLMRLQWSITRGNARIAGAVGL